ncbi:cytochrome c [Beijerinckia sp. L45]|uniref:c-type cytochrome n=1 Tax=Beijerinckia sp. L45 TaxID=1641855 RepID=UPI00131C2AEF|nr:cytochrome c [Beijerinckia sp. L45]
MRRSLVTNTLSIAILALSTCGYAVADDKQSFEQIERGRYLAAAGDCAACHTVPGGAPFAGGLPLVTPFGTIVSTNITPDPKTGIGAWSDDAFVDALHKGVRADGSQLYPAMPYPSYTKVTRDDALAIRAYLQTVTPVDHDVVADQLPFPLSIRKDMAVWNMLNFTEGFFQPTTSKSAEWNRGAYLVQGLGHCGTCHTPKSALGAEKADVALKGSEIESWLAPDLTDDKRTGLGNWTSDDIESYLKTGSNQHGIASGPMSEVIRFSTSAMSDPDLKAIAVYLKDLKTAPSPAVTAQAASTAQMTAGAAIYKDSCAACHRDDGHGVPHLFPRLAGNGALQASEAVSAVHIVLHGSQGVGTKAAPTAPAMPAFDWVLNDAQVAAVLTYVRNTWGNAAAPVSAGDVGKYRTAGK